MDKSIVMEILGLLEATPAVLVVAGIGFIFAGIVFAILIFLYRQNKALNAKYHLLNISAVRLWDRVDPDMVQSHYSGEWYLGVRANSAASKVLHGEGRSKAAKTRAGSALTQRI